MEILSETPRKVWDLEVEWKDKEYAGLNTYAKDNIPPKVLNELLVSWAVSDILEKYIDAHFTGVKKKIKKPKSSGRTGKTKS